MSFYVEPEVYDKVGEEGGELLQVDLATLEE